MDETGQRQANQTPDEVEGLTPEERAIYLNLLAASDPVLTMTASRWQQVKEILGAVLELPSTERTGYLSGVRARDPELCRDVELFLSCADDECPPSLSAPHLHRLPQGTKLGAYEVISFLGAGGMGEVYRARDQRLKRDVAIKVLAGNWPYQADLLHRFEQEAQAAAALNHSNILTIFDIGTHEEAPYFVTELLLGASLRENLRGSKLPMDKATYYALQIARGLAALHSRDIIHRDIKPDNLFVTQDDIIKILDFGLVKLAKPDSNASHQLHTAAGVFVGTVPYMAPEQLKGERIDHRVDVWSWAVVFYEMLAGRRPFDAPTRAEVQAAILTKEPLPPCNSHKINQVVLRALSKNPEERYQTMREVIEDLDSIFVDIRNSADKTRKSTARLRRLMFLVSVTVIGAAFYIYRQESPNHHSSTDQSSRFRHGYISTIIRLTHSRPVTKATISPDGTVFAFVTQEGHGQALWVRQTEANAEARKLHQISNGDYGGITLSRDGQFIYYVIRQKEHGQLYRMSLINGQPTMVHDDVDSFSVSWDQKRAAFVRYDTNTPRSAVILGELETGQETNLVTLAPPEYLWNTPVWSPNGKDLLVTVLSAAKVGEPTVKLIAFGTSGNREVVVQAHAWRWAGTPVWLEEGRIVIAAGKSTSRSNPVLELSWPQDMPISLIDDGWSYGDLATSADRSRIVTVRTIRESVPWIVSLSGSESAKPVSSFQGTFYGIAWARSGQLISERDADSLPNLWSVEPRTGTMEQITHDNIIAEDPTVSPDGRYLVYASRRDGDRHLWRFNLDGTDPLRLTSDKSNSFEESPSITPDGRSVVFKSLKAGYPALWKVSINGGQATQLTEPGRFAREPSMSPDGKMIVCQYIEKPGDGWSTVVLNAANGKVMRSLYDIPAGDGALVPRWSANSKSLLYVVTQNGVSNIRSLPIHGGDSRPRTHFKDQQIFAFAISPDGTRLACIRGTTLSEAVMIEVTK